MSLNTYVINLDKDAARWKRQSVELKKVGLQPIRIPGILGKDVPIGLIDKHFTKTCNAFCPMSVIGCATSHLKAMNHFYSNDPAPFCLIMEDDAYPMFTQISQLNEFVKTLPPPDKWDMCLLHCDGKCPVRGEAPFANPMSGSGAAYLITKGGCKKLLEGGNIISHHLDLTTSKLPGFIKLVSPDNFFWTDEDSKMIAPSPTDTSNNRTPNSHWTIYDRIMNVICDTFWVNRGEKTWKHIRGYKAVRVPLTEKEFTASEVFLAIWISLILLLSPNKLRDLTILLIIYNF